MFVSHRCDRNNVISRKSDHQTEVIHWRTSVSTSHYDNHCVGDMLHRTSTLSCGLEYCNSAYTILQGSTIHDLLCSDEEEAVTDNVHKHICLMMCTLRKLDLCMYVYVLMEIK